jgi:putative peptidoglycan lipid II flippase
VFRRAGFLAVLTLLATASGLVREAVVAFSFGTSGTADAMALSVFLIDLVNTLFLTGGVGFAFVPVIKRIRRTHGDVDARRLVTALVSRIAIVALALGCLIAAELPRISSGLMSNPLSPAAAHLLPVLRGGIVAASIMAVGSALAASLYGFERFGTAAFARLGWNITMAAALLGLSVLSPISRAAISLLGASVVALLICAFAFWQGTARAEWRWHHPELRTVLLAAAPGLLALAFGNVLLGGWERALLAKTGVGSIAIVNYAQRASYMASTLSLAVHIVAFNEIVTALQTGGSRAVRDLIEGMLRRVLLVLGPLVAVMITAREPIITILYGRGAFGAESIATTGTVFGLYALDVILVFVMGILLRVLYAIERPWQAALTIVVSSLAAGIADTLLISHFGVSAIPIGYGVGLLVGVIAALLQLRVVIDLRLTSALMRAVRLGAGIGLLGGIVVSSMTRGAGDILHRWAAGPSHSVVQVALLSSFVLGQVVVIGGISLLAARVLRVPEALDFLRVGVGQNTRQQEA